MNAWACSPRRHPAVRRFQEGGILAVSRRCPDLSFRPGRARQRAFVEGIHYLKALDATVQAIERVRVEKNLVLRGQGPRFRRGDGLRRPGPGTRPSD